MSSGLKVVIVLAVAISLRYIQSYHLDTLNILGNFLGGSMDGKSYFNLLLLRKDACSVPKILDSNRRGRRRGCSCLLDPFSLRRWSLIA